jgi:hypothetical protein
VLEINLKRIARPHYTLYTHFVHPTHKYFPKKNTAHFRKKTCYTLQYRCWTKRFLIVKLRCLIIIDSVILFQSNSSILIPQRKKREPSHTPSQDPLVGCQRWGPPLPREKRWQRRSASDQLVEALFHFVFCACASFCHTDLLEVINDFLVKSIPTNLS